MKRLPQADIERLHRLESRIRGHLDTLHGVLEADPQTPVVLFVLRALLLSVGEARQLALGVRGLRGPDHPELWQPGWERQRQLDDEED